MSKPEQAVVKTKENDGFNFIGYCADTERHFQNIKKPND